MSSETLQALKLRAQEGGLPTLENLDHLGRFYARCNGDAQLAYDIIILNFEENTELKYVREHDGNFPPCYAVVLTHPSGDKAMLIIESERDKESAAAEITDPICVKAGCNGGANCVAKSISSRNRE